MPPHFGWVYYDMSFISFRHLGRGGPLAFFGCFMSNPGADTELRLIDKRFSLKFRVDSKVLQEILEESQRTHRPKSYRNNNKDEDNSPKTLNDKKRFLRKLFVLDRYT